MRWKRAQVSKVGGRGRGIAKRPFKSTKAKRFSAL